MFYYEPNYNYQEVGVLMKSKIVRIMVKIELHFSLRWCDTNKEMNNILSSCLRVRQKRDY
jgi:hypothetical protein